MRAADTNGPVLVEVSGIALLDAFAKQHPQFASAREPILARLPVRVRVHADWWLNVRSLTSANDEIKRDECA